MRRARGPRPPMRCGLLELFAAEVAVRRENTEHEAHQEVAHHSSSPGDTPALLHPERSPTQDTRPAPTMSRWARVLLDTLVPRSCEVCARDLPAGHAWCVCGCCWASMPPLPKSLCIACGVPLPRPLPHTHCPTCIGHPPRFTTARAASLYLPATAGLNPLATAIHHLKYAGRRGLAGPLGALLAERFPFGNCVLLVPVPPHPSRLRKRGFNQAVDLARALGRRRGLPVAPRALVRIRATSAQTGLAATERRRNLRGAFVVHRPTVVAHRHVVLVDDVLTTGATADACAGALLAAGARRVDVYTLGRAP